MRAPTALLVAALLLLAAPAASAGPLDDADGDSIPDAIEPAVLCRADNRALNSDGTCHSGYQDYRTPTDEGINGDYAWFMEAVCLSLDPACQVAPPPESLPLPPIG